ncbi:RES family NAD+ phosphorylase [Rhodohalobacter sp. 8-1]|uniref:RES family NAD+ phosphorylase n=1 Tax=Rhodohalobacter sp. 8-1 TaxID=3131972 RepID=UPI0030ED3A95
MFSKWNAFQAFEKRILNKNRFIFNEETKFFLDAVLESAKERVRVIDKNTNFWRAQIGHDFTTIGVRKEDQSIQIPSPFRPERMTPLTAKAYEGRINPKGIPTLYLSTDSKTAMAEARPWKFSLISVGMFAMVNDIKVIDCSKDHDRPIFYVKPPQDAQNIKKAVWSHIDSAFSKPLQRSDNEAYYAPTQIISEMFKEEGYDGIYYKSGLENGHNIALFDLKSAEMVRCNLFRLEDINYEFELIGNTYYVSNVKDSNDSET